MAIPPFCDQLGYMEKNRTSLYVLDWNEPWPGVFDRAAFREGLLREVLPPYLYQRRWFGGKSSTLKQVIFDHIVRVNIPGRETFFLVLEVLFAENFVQHYFVPLTIATDSELPEGAVPLARLSGTQGEALLVDALFIEDFRSWLFHAIDQEQQYPFDHGMLRFSHGSHLEEGLFSGKVDSRLLGADQSNTSIIYGEKYFLKVFRRLFRDANPDLEMVYFLTEETGYGNTPSYVGKLYLDFPGMFEVSLGLMQEKLDNEGDAWKWMLNHTHRLVRQNEGLAAVRKDAASRSFFKGFAPAELSTETRSFLGEELIRDVQLLARRTAEMHIALSSTFERTSFNPVPYNSDYTVWLKNRLMFQFDNRYSLVEKNLYKLQGLARRYALQFLEKKPLIINTFLGFDENKLTGRRIRIHGDYHLGQVLRRDGDFYIIDFEGEPESTIRDRKVKQSPLKDVAGMFRSFHYALYAAIFLGEPVEGGEEVWSMHAEPVYELLCGIFLHTYYELAFHHSLAIGYLPEITYLLKYNLLEKAVYELGYELNGRPDWAIIPLTGIMQLLPKE